MLHKTEILGYMDGIVKGKTVRIPVREAPGDIILMPNQADIKSADRYSPESCMHAQYCKRVFGGRAAIMRKYAYVQMLDEDGDPIFNRFLVPARTRKTIVEFDEGKSFKTFAARLQAPTAGNQIKSARKIRKIESRDKKKLETLTKKLGHAAAKKAAKKLGLRMPRPDTPVVERSRKYDRERMRDINSGVRPMVSPTTYLRSGLNMLKLYKTDKKRGASR